MQPQRFGSDHRLQTKTKKSLHHAGGKKNGQSMGAATRRATQQAAERMTAMAVVAAAQNSPCWSLLLSAIGALRLVPLAQHAELPWNLPAQGKEVWQRGLQRGLRPTVQHTLRPGPWL